MVLQKQSRLEKFLDSANDFGRNKKNKKWFKVAISEMGLKEKWITEDQSNNRLVKILLFFGLLLLMIANILLVKCYKNSLEMKKPNWIINNDKGSYCVLYSKVSIIRPGCSRLLEFEKKIVLVV